MFIMNKKIIEGLDRMSLENTKDLEEHVLGTIISTWEKGRMISECTRSYYEGLREYNITREYSGGQNG